MTQFRLSSHALEIERGRYNNTPSEKRFCTYCKDMIGREIVEDEEHFIFHCPISKELREKCTPNLVTQKSHLRDEQKLVHILSNKYDIKTTAKYIYLAQEHRKTTLDVLKFIQNLTDEVVSQVRNSKNETYISDLSNAGLKMTLTKT